MTAAPEGPVPSQRLFFALWPDEEARGALAAAVARAVSRSGGRPVPPGNLHVTLAFLGPVAMARIPELQAIAHEQTRTLAPQPPLSLRFAHFAHWGRPQILCVLGAEESPAAQKLATALKDAVAAAGFTPDLKPFHAHVTVARKVVHGSAAPLARPVTWRFAEFALIDSRTESSGPVYSVIESYSLVTAQKARE